MQDKKKVLVDCTGGLGECAQAMELRDFGKSEIVDQEVEGAGELGVHSEYFPEAKPGTIILDRDQLDVGGNLLKLLNHRNCVMSPDFIHYTSSQPTLRRRTTSR